MSDTVEFAEGGLRLDLGRVARLTLCRPAARNAISFAMWNGLREAMAYISNTVTIRVLIVTGKGNKAFSAGANITEFPKTYETAAASATYNEAVHRAQAALAELSIPTIAEVRGVCFGGGCGLAMHCDLRFVSETALFAITPSRLGLAYPFEETARLVSLVGPARSKDILMSARVIKAQEALAIGLVNRVMPESDLGKSVLDYAVGLASLSRSSIQIAKQTVEAITHGEKSASTQLKSAIESTFSGPDFSEGYAAFIEKRVPKFE